MLRAVRECGREFSTAAGLYVRVKNASRGGSGVTTRKNICGKWRQAAAKATASLAIDAANHAKDMPS
jgi:predicted secreted protein